MDSRLLEQPRPASLVAVQGADYESLSQEYLCVNTFRLDGIKPVQGGGFDLELIRAMIIFNRCYNEQY